VILFGYHGSANPETADHCNVASALCWDVTPDWLEPFLDEVYEHKRRGMKTLAFLFNVIWRTQVNWDPAPDFDESREWTLRTETEGGTDAFIHRLRIVVDALGRAGLLENIIGVYHQDEPFGRALNRDKIALANDIRSANAALAREFPKAQRLITHSVFELEPGRSEEMPHFSDGLGFTVASFDVYSNHPHTAADYLRYLNLLRMRYKGLPYVLVPDGRVYRKDTPQAKLERINAIYELGRQDPQCLGLLPWTYLWAPGAASDHQDNPEVGAVCDVSWLQERYRAIGKAITGR
jgi:hypothetical protein